MSAPPRFLFAAEPAAAAAALAAVRRAGPVEAQLAPSADALEAALAEGPWDAVVVVPGGEVEAALHVPDGVPLVVVDGDEALVLSDDDARGLPLCDLPMLRAASAAGDGYGPAHAGDAGGPLLSWADDGEDPAAFLAPPGDGAAGDDPLPPQPPPRPEVPPAESAPQPGPQPDASAERPSLLVVEDNGDTRMLLERILRSAYDVTAVGDARSALLAMNGRRFDGLVLDINLGGKETGADVLRIARSLAGYEGVFAIALTAYALPGDRERLLEAGFSEYLSKPFTRQSLMDALASGVRG